MFSRQSCEKRRARMEKLVWRLVRSSSTPRKPWMQEWKS